MVNIGTLSYTAPEVPLMRAETVTNKPSEQ